MQLSLCLLFLLFIFIRSSQDGPYYVIGYDEWRPGVYTGFRTITVCRIFTKLGHMIPLWKGKNPIYFGVIRSKVTVTINIIFDNRVVSERQL
jgi:hypothetical protein